MVGKLPKFAITMMLMSVLFSASARSQSLVLNGSFEDSFLTGCKFSLTNEAFTAALPNVTAFGTGNHLDLLQGICFSEPAPADGQYKVGITFESIHGTQDAFSLRLASALVAGSTYRLTYSATSLLAGGVTQPGVIDIGVSTTPNAFGTQVHTGSTIYGSWTTHVVEFVAPLAATDLTIRAGTNPSNSFLQVDDFSLVLVPATGWSDLGSGLAGTNGVPLLFGTGTLLPGSSGSLTLVSARASSGALLALSISSVPVPVLGGVLVAHPVAITLPATTDTFGIIAFNWVMLPPAAVGQTVFCQWLIADPLAPGGVAFSNALRGQFP